MQSNSRTDVLATASHDDDNLNNSSNPSLNDIIDARMSRRGVFRAAFSTAGGAVLGSMGLSACGGGGSAASTPAATVAKAATLGFTAVAKNKLDTVTIATGYTARTIYALGDPLTAATSAYLNDGTDTDFDNRAGDHHDGMEYFGLSTSGTADASSSDRGLLVMNHEAITDQFLHAAGVSARPRPASETDKEVPAHGVSIVEVRKTAGVFSYQQSSTFNRRITPLTPMEIKGVARGNALMQTKFSNTGNDCRGTINNCGTGYTPWGTYLSGEENWSGYFTRSATDNTTRGGATAKSVISLNRYGRSQGASSRHGWETSGTDDKYARWIITQGTGAATDDYRNEMNTFGYMVEIDPYDKTAAIRKRTTLGRFAHESGVFGKVTAGKPLAVYMGDDSRGEYIYKYVSNTTWSAADATPANRMNTGDKYLDNGKLYVAKFNADGSGQWIELSMSNSTLASATNYSFADNGDVAMNSRLAADAVGATRMDRPEWCAVNPINGEIYYTLTNNANRKLEPTSSQQGLDAANPRSYQDSFNSGALGSAQNVNGHILRMREDSDEPSAVSFRWDVYLFGAQADADTALVNLSGLSTDQDFSSPDGLWFSPKSGLCFIQTDDGAYTDVTNCMMLIGRPGQVGDGTTPTLSYTKADNTKVDVQTRMGVKPTVDTLRRFLVGPVDCEITGCCETPDGKALFVNIQHPGETITKANVSDASQYLSHWPGNAGYGAGGANARPRSATIVITKNDGGLIGT
ncbi:PhoX family phosphatase [Rhodoferax sp. TBRC 17660]|uniref:PhoX family phosphatase n=1 Tax=Rhodoferax potami TaxID=3068338 RepID=A0ABU3KMU2_9BURK|nr:PhoX family phosphatase [Rhodoferax sp. TBRC 17660]MDT7518579.1 PhoX family phosphatase [Rhodoferax sp. TBRC 17660]